MVFEWRGVTFDSRCARPNLEHVEIFAEDECPFVRLHHVSGNSAHQVLTSDLLTDSAASGAAQLIASFGSFIQIGLLAVGAFVRALG